MQHMEDLKHCGDERVDISCGSDAIQLLFFRTCESFDCVIAALKPNINYIIEIKGINDLSFMNKFSSGKFHKTKVTVSTIRVIDTGIVDLSQLKKLIVTCGHALQNLELICNTRLCDLHDMYDIFLATRLRKLVISNGMNDTIKYNPRNPVIFPTFINEHLRSLDVDFVNDKQIDVLVDSLPRMNALKVLTLQMRVPYSQTEIRRLACAVMECPVLDIFAIHNLYIGGQEFLDTLSQCKYGKLRRLILNACCVSCVTKAFDVLPETRLESLLLTIDSLLDLQNGRVDKMAQQILQCHRLQRLNIDGCNGHYCFGHYPVRADTSGCGKLYAAMNIDRELLNHFITLRSAQECNRVGKHSAIKRLPRDLTRYMKSFLV